MTAIIFFIISTSGVNTLLLPASPVGITTGFSVSKDAEAIFYNPANLDAGDNYRFWCSYNRFYVSTQSVSLALAKRIKSVALGIAFINFDYGDIEWHPDYPTEDTLTYYSGNDFSIVLGGSARISPQGKIGLNLKYISENIYLYSGCAFAFDIAFSYGSSKSGISFGASNFGTKLTLKNEEVNLPARISLGGFYRLKKLIASVDVHHLVNYGKMEFGFGLGFPICKIADLNGALHYREALYPGFGLELKPGKLTIKYAGSFYPKDLGMINSMGIGFEF
ncbi:hypothetical protein ES705_08748 [subsurface metagenome]